MATSLPEGHPLSVLERMHQAVNAHDIDAFVELFSPDYRSEQPAHPDRQFGGRDQVRENWEGTFEDVPDFHAELLRSAVSQETVWSEWDWYGTRRDGSRLEMRGVMLMGVQAGQIAWARLYMEFVERGGAGIREVVRRIRGPGQTA
jgi:ketosteroid isomerase-like protein